MPARVNAIANTQEPSKVKKVLLAPVRWLAVGLIIASVIVFVISLLVLFVIVTILRKLYCLAGGKLPEWLEQRAAAFEEIIHVPQTTHNTDINDAININIKKLKENYGEPDIEDGFTKEIENFINKLKCITNDTEKAADKYQLKEDEKKHALECLERIQNNPDIHSGSGLTLKQVLNLVWKACNDKGKKSAGSNIDIDTRMLQRKYQLVQHLIESQTEYGVYGDHGSSACFTGTFNSIVSSLYIFEEFSFLQRVNKDNIKQEFEDELQTKGEELFNQLSNKEKEEVAKALSSAPSTRFFSDYVESFKNHPARAVLGDKECNELVRAHLYNLQYNEVISNFSKQ
ncbi:hypothetical protein EJB10_03715 [Wolbachia endosymbiont of Brugia malayi]|uniref:hypothetical protein n=1 Tax=unclassified Wolbachia TaxID=2640676 RepID=UPI00004C9331|nr:MULTISPECIES: hypothetical protein [unclassified Wolbachia]AAW70880.1 Predicted membrane protein WF-2 [Wolbachia endosymbiont strain TRS of Brugia malayi]QCB61838.1 hypothetical protein EJB10_03715 [Wolbachia endosymbiont of Brugia malayi]QIT35795.1 putative membrane protein WF-2 [Wolbachia endosymbiont of Brugia pahangi]